MYFKTPLLALVAAAAVAACGGDSGSGAGINADSASMPAIKLNVTATDDFAGSYGSVGAYEKLTGTLSGEVDPADPRTR